MPDDFYKLEPSMIAANWAALGDDAQKCRRAGIEILHLDVMDGHFVKNLTMGPDIVTALKKREPDLVLDVHLMIYSPENYLERFIQAGADEVTIHLEATKEVSHSLKFIRTCNRKAGLAIKPETRETLLLNYLHQVDKILIMTVHPGFGGQKFIEEMLDKVRFIRQKADEEGLTIDIQVDGGINLDTCARAVDAGANRFVAGTAFFKEEDLQKTHLEYRKLWNQSN